MNAGRVDLLIQAAGLIRSPPPGRLVGALALLAARAWKWEQRVLRSPTRAATRQKLKRVRRAADELGVLLNDPQIASLIPKNEPPVPFREWPLPTAQQVRELSGSMSEWLSRIPGGAGSARLDDALGWPRGRLLCAVGIASFWEEMRGSLPGKRNHEALEACALVWRVAGGAPTRAAQAGDVDDRLSWERHMTEAVQGFRDPRAADAVVHARLIAAETWEDAAIGDAFRLPTGE
jgi:hypothetical protein